MVWNLIEESKKLIGIQSVTNVGNRALVDYLVPFCRRLGLNLLFQAAKNGEQELNLIASTLPAGSPNLCPDGLLWVTHLDTVPPGDPALWTETGNDPFRATIKEDRIYGLGSADTKLDFLCKLKALEAVGPERLKVPFCLVGTYGEERALAGIKQLRQSGLVRPRYALVGEPSELQPVVKHKGILYMKLTFHADTSDSSGRSDRSKRQFIGRAAHGSTPHLGENAIQKGCEWLFQEQKGRPNLQLLSIQGGTVHNIVPERCEIEVGAGSAPSPSIRFLKNFWDLIGSANRRLLEVQDPEFDPPVTTCNVGVVRTVGETIEIEFDFRLIPSTDGNELFEIFRKLEDFPGARIQVLSSNAPMETPRQSDLVKRVGDSLKTSGLPCSFMVKSGNTEGAILREMGAEAVVIGPGRSTGNIHRPNEYNEISQLKKAVEFYTEFLKGFF